MAVGVAAARRHEPHLAFVVELGGAVAEGDSWGSLPALVTEKVTRRPARTMIASGR